MENRQTFDEETMALLLAMREKGVMDQALLNVFEKLPRRLFVNANQVISRLGPESMVPIPCGQLQTPPIITAQAITRLRLTSQDKILEIGTGSGYQSAILAHLCARLYTLDRFNTLIEQAEQRFESLKLKNVLAQVGDGELGWPDKGVFDHIVLNASVEKIPEKVLEQLKLGGSLIAPILKKNVVSVLTCFTKTDEGLVVKTLCEARFLPLIPGIASRL